MGKPKITNFAQVLRLVNLLTDDEKTTLRDVLRPERVVSKKASKTSPKQVKAPICAVCGNFEHHDDHKSGYLSSHEFVAPSAGKRSSRKSAAKEPSASSGTSLDDAGAAQAASGGD